MLETSFALSIVSVREGMRRVSPLREFLSSLVFFSLCVCVCVCACTETQRERRGEGETQKTFMERYHTTNARTPQGLTGTARREEGRERERESGREEHSVHCAAHVDMCEQGAKGARGAHHASHSLTHSLTSLVPLVPHLFCERESAREEERKRPRERGEKEKDTCKDLFFAMSFFLHSLSH